MQGFDPSLDFLQVYCWRCGEAWNKISYILFCKYICTFSREEDAVGADIYRYRPLTWVFWQLSEP